jgi:serine/threonine protein kinase
MGLSIPQMARMSRLLDEALPLDAAGRRAWLEMLAQEHEDLAPALRQALLPEVAQAAGDNALAALPRLDSLSDANAHSSSGLQAGARVGPYELIRLLGAGGMAEVWLARRADGAFKRELALKLPMLSRLRGDLEPRFARERDILASLEHPHIARLYDAGVDPQGLPYLSMEYVQGEPLTNWCDGRRLGVAERLALFLQVLEAVQCAHEKQVIHRDLKPSNILVSDSGQVRLLDFGVAKLLEAEEADQIPLTSVYGRALTPDYASPELLRGDPIDARSDLYSLGVLLYELLTGCLPYRLKSAASIGLLDRAIATVEVKKPSMRLEQAVAAAGANVPEPRVRQLRGDLDAIVLKALAKDPAQRYPSAASMADDLQRHLAGKPVQAQPARVSYRLHKFVLRNKTMVGVSATAVAAILAMVGYTRYRESLAQVTVTANAVAIPATPNPGASVAAFAPPAHSVAVLPFIDMSEKKDQEYFSDGLAEELLDLLTKIPGLQVIARTSSFSFKGKSDDIPTIARKLNVANVLEGSVRRSGDRLRVTTQLVRADTGVHIWSETYDRELKDIFKVQDNIAAAVVTALKLQLLPSEHIAGAHRTDNTEAYTQYLLGRQFEGLHSLDDYRRAVAAYRKAIELDPNFAAAYAGLSTAQFWASDQTGDAAGVEQAMSAAEKAIALEPEQVDGYTARAYLRITVTWDWTGAQADLEKALTLDPGNSAIQSGYGVLKLTLGQLPEAVAALRKSVELDPLSSEAWNWLGYTLTANHEFASAQQALARALQISPGSEFALSNSVELHLLQGHALEALPVAQQITRVWRLYSLATTQHSLGHAKESQQALNLLIAEYSREAAYQVAEVYAWRGEKDKAFEWLERAYHQRDTGLTEIKISPMLWNLHADPRFAAMVRKMNLPE